MRSHASLCRAVCVPEERGSSVCASLCCWWETAAALLFVIGVCVVCVYKKSTTTTTTTLFSVPLCCCADCACSRALVVVRTPLLLTTTFDAATKWLHFLNVDNIWEQALDRCCIISTTIHLYWIFNSDYFPLVKNVDLKLLILFIHIRGIKSWVGVFKLSSVWKQVGKRLLYDTEDEKDSEKDNAAG